MKEGSSLKEHHDEINEIVMELRGMNVKMKHEDLRLILRGSLPPFPFDHKF